MKVLFVCSGNSDTFKIVPFIQEQGESLRKVGIDVDYFPIVGRGIAGYLKAGLALRKHMENNQYDLIHAHFTYSGWSAVIGARKTPVVLSLMGDDAYGTFVGVNKVSFRGRISTLLTLCIQPFVKALICKSGNIAKFVYTKHKSYIIPNGIDTQKFKPDYQIKREINGSNPVKKVLFLGNKENARKNYMLAKAAVDKLQNPNVELVNPFPVSHTEIPKWLNTADVLVLTSWMEGSPNVIKEGMACNCPIVATDIGDVKWVLGPTEGCYVSSFNENEFSEKLKLALNFAEKSGRTNGVQRISELGLDAETVAGKIISVYNSSLRKPRTK